jgi:hypothetical protein
VWRCRSDGSLGCATPCLLCRRELLRFDLRVHCPLDNGTWFRGRLDEGGAPPPALTSGQRRQLNVNLTTPAGDGSKALVTSKVA